MNLPNKLTLLRVFMIPFFVVFMLTDLGGSYGKYIALAIFIAASLTDMLDGKIARKYNLVTNFGKFMDPLADKLLVCSAMICLVDKGRLASWIVIIIISFVLLEQILIYVALILTVVSLVDYLMKNKDVLKDGGK